MGSCTSCANFVGCDLKHIVSGCEDYRPIHIKKEIITMKEMLEMQKQLQGFLGTNFDDMTIEERTAFIKEHSIHLTQEIHEALYELPFFKPWKDYSGMTVDEQAEQIKKYKKEMVDAFHFFMNMMLAVDFTYEELRDMYMEKNRENFERQRRGYTHDVSYREV